MSAPHQVLVIGLGNPDRGDDGFGPAVVAALREHLPPDVSLRTRAGDMLALIDDWDGFPDVICIDAAAAIGAPGQVHRVDLAVGALPFDLAPASGHAFGLAEAMALAQQLGRAPRTLVVYAAEGECFDIGCGLTAPVSAAVQSVAALVLAECARLQSEAAAR